ncbi:MAG: hypothetical protein KC910_27300 [Candidatus Eremiobacteraeota bacterium]|nr:hypothetical protein [Candidatus Eremiobacteraeota bacterium]
MTRRYNFSPDMLKTYSLASVVLVFFGILGLLCGFVSMAGWTTMRRASALPMLFILAGLGALGGSAVPFRQAVTRRNSYIEVDDQGLLWHRASGDEDRIAWSEVKDVMCSDTTLTIMAAVTIHIPAEYENFGEVVNQAKRWAPAF